MAKHAGPRTRSPFWTIMGGTAAAVALFAGGAATQVWQDSIQSEQAAQVRALPRGGVEVGDGSGPQEAQTADAYGCYWWPDGPAWVSDRTPDGLCHDGPHGQPYWATGAYSGNEVLREGTAAHPPREYYAADDDDPRWDCTMQGNHVCGPDNPQGAPAGCYGTGGVLAQRWDDDMAAELMYAPEMVCWDSDQPSA